VNYQNIKTFLAIAELKSMANAGKALHFSQQVVSEHLKQLERELGVALVLRKKGNRQIALTKDGSDFLPLARSWVEFQEDFDDRVARFIQTRGRRVFRLAASASAHQYIIAHIVHKLMLAFPELELRLSVVEISGMSAAIEGQAFDAAFMFEAVPEHPSVTAIPLFAEERCILCPINTALPERVIPVEHLDPHYEVVYTNFINNKAYNDWRKAYLPVEAEPHLRTDSLIAVHNYLVDARSWAIVPISMAKEFISRAPEKLTMRHITPAPAPRTFSVLVARQYPEDCVIRELLHCCEEYIAERPHLRRITDIGC